MAVTVLAEEERRRLAALTPTCTSAPDGRLPAGMQAIDHEIALPQGPDVFDRLADAILSWQIQSGAGLEVRASALEVREGDVVSVVKHLGPFRARAECRVIEVVRTTEEAGFAYATLPHHPEIGVERFRVLRDASGLVTFRVDGFSRPSHFVYRIARPLVMLIAHRTIESYLSAAVRLARG